MAQKYLSEFYSYKAKVAGGPVIVAEPSSALEQQVRAHVLAGNLHYFAGRYAPALTQYLAAWGLLPQLFFPIWKSIASLVRPEELLGVEMTAQLLGASHQLMRVREAVGPAAQVAPPINPPEKLLGLAQEYVGRDLRRADTYERGLSLLQSGELRLARKLAGELLEIGRDDRTTQADALVLFAAIDLAERNFDQAREHIGAAQQLFSASGQPEGIAAAQFNAAIAMTRAGRTEEAGKLFAEVASRAPAGLGWAVTHSTNPGIASVSRGFGSTALPLMARTVDGAWGEMVAQPTIRLKDTATVVAGEKPVRLDLRAGAEELEATLLKPRIEATSLAELQTSYWLLPQFVGYLTHVGGFILPMALGDTYAALGDAERALSYYLRVRDYPYLNSAIERPMLWRKLAQIRIASGNRLYRDRNMAAARAEYEQVLRILPGGDFQLSGALYDGAFAPYVAEHTAFLNAASPLAFGSIEYGRRALLLEARNNLRRILANINYLGFPEEIVPIHSWRYLQNVARYFANHATQGERAYITFKESAEREEFTRLALEQAVDAQAAALDVERQRLRAAQEQLVAAQRARNQAQVRLSNAQAQRAQYAAISGQLAAIEEILAFTNATGLNSDIRIKQSWANLLGISAGTYDPAILVQLLTRARTRLTQQYELANLDRQIAEMQAALAVARQQVVVAQAMVDVAESQLELAELKLEQSQAQLEHFDAQEFTPELWDNLAQAQRELSQRYLDWAIGAAFLMERAFEYDYDREVNRIRFDYFRSELNGLLAADYLLADIDAFSFDRITETEKQVPMKFTVSLADRYPAQFRDFQRSGRIDFEILLQDVDALHPGTCVRKLKRVELVVEGLVGPRGLHGTLANAGISHDRGRDGARKTRVQRPETMVLSQFDLRQDGFVFSSDEELLALFENSGPAGGWVLEFPPESNDVDYRGISNLHLVLYYDAFYSPTAAERVRAELAATAIYQGSLGLSLRHQYPDEFFALRDGGSVTCTLDNAYLPYNHADPRLREVYVLLEAAPGVSNEGIVLGVATAAGGFSASQTTDASGLIATGGGAEPLNGLRGAPLADSWTFTIRPTANAAAFAAGFAWDKVANIHLFVDYDYTPRGLPARRQDFAGDPLPSFAVVDDPQALTGAPSAWSYDAAAQALRQTSSIHHPPGAAGNNSQPAKPGAYLVRQTDAQWPALADGVVRARMSAASGGGIGLLFRYQDADNFHFLLLDAQRGYRRIGKKVGGVFHELDQSAVDSTGGYPQNAEFEVALAVVGSAFTAYLDGAQILSGNDSTIPGAGQVGLYVWNNATARFFALSAQGI